MKKFNAAFVMIAPIAILVSCAQTGTDRHQAQQSVRFQQTSRPAAVDVAAGRTLFLRNCAHCHGADAHGDEGPDLHNLDWTDQQIAIRIRSGKAGQMTAFNGKLSSLEIDSLIVYIQTLK